MSPRQHHRRGTVSSFLLVSVLVQPQYSAATLHHRGNNGNLHLKIHMYPTAGYARSAQSNSSFTLLTPYPIPSIATLVVDHFSFPVSPTRQ